VVLVCTSVALFVWSGQLWLIIDQSGDVGNGGNERVGVGARLSGAWASVCGLLVSGTARWEAIVGCVLDMKN